MNKSTKFAGIKINNPDRKIMGAIKETILGDSYMSEAFNGPLPEDIQKQILSDMPHLKGKLPEFAMVIRDSLDKKRWGFMFKAGTTDIFMAPVKIIMDLRKQGYCK